MTCQPKASTLEHQLWRMQDWSGVTQTITYWSWPHRSVNPVHLLRTAGIEVNQTDMEYFYRRHIIPYYFLLSGALPSELA